MKYFSKIHVFAALILGSIFGLSSSVGRDDNRAGHPLDAGSCGNCHSGGFGTGSIALTGVPTTITPGQIYPLMLTLNDDMAYDGGFQIVAVSGPSVNTQVGSFVNFPVNTRLTTTGRLTHGSPLQLTTSGSVSWNFAWRAPNSPLSQVYFYYSVNAVNGDGDTDGDTARNGVSSSIPLPIALVSFDVKRQDDYLRFDWSTFTEKNAAHFEIESSTDGTHFKLIGKENASGNSDKPQYYSTKVFQGLQDAYFRLKMVDLDGSFKYSEIVFSKQKTVLPKVHMSSGSIAITFTETVSATVSIYDLIGRQMIHEAKQDINSWTHDIHSYPKGIYIVQITGTQFEKFAQRFVVQ